MDQQVAHGEIDDRALLELGACQLPANDLGRVLGKPADGAGIEGFDAEIPFLFSVVEGYKSLDPQTGSYSYGTASQLCTLISQGHLNTFCMKYLKLNVPFCVFIKLLINMLYHSYHQPSATRGCYMN